MSMIITAFLAGALVTSVIAIWRYEKFRQDYFDHYEKHVREMGETEVRMVRYKVNMDSAQTRADFWQEQYDRKSLANATH